VLHFEVESGILESQDLIEIPAYLINGDPSTLVFHNEASEFFVQASTNVPVLSQPITIPAGNWEVEVISNTGVSIDILDQGDKMLAHGLSTDHLRYPTDSGRVVTIAMRSREATSADVYKILLHRIG
jgi:hypothetical protein